MLTRLSKENKRIKTKGIKEIRGKSMKEKIWNMTLIQP